MLKTTLFVNLSRKIGFRNLQNNQDIINPHLNVHNESGGFVNSSRLYDSEHCSFSQTNTNHLLTDVIFNQLNGIMKRIQEANTMICKISGVQYRTSETNCSFFLTDEGCVEVYSSQFPSIRFKRTTLK